MASGAPAGVLNTVRANRSPPSSPPEAYEVPSLPYLISELPAPNLSGALLAQNPILEPLITIALPLGVAHLSMICKHVALRTVAVEDQQVPSCVASSGWILVRPPLFGPHHAPLKQSCCDHG